MDIMKVLSCYFMCLLFLILRWVFSQEVSVRWIGLDNGNTYGTSTAIEGQLSAAQCLSKCLATTGCVSVNVQREHLGCEVSAEHPLDKSLVATQRPGWTVFYKDLKNCKDVLNTGDKTTGFKYIIPDGINAVRALCVMNIDNGGWTVIQKRESNSDFYKNWQEYRDGFGDDTNFWIGLETMHRLTSQGKYELRIDMKRYTNSQATVKYQTFAVGSESAQYQLSVSDYSYVPTYADPADPGDSFSRNSGLSFTTKDRDNDRNAIINCAEYCEGGFWYRSTLVRCISHLNSVYGSTKAFVGIIWPTWTGDEPLVYTRMMIRPK